MFKTNREGETELTKTGCVGALGGIALLVLALSLMFSVTQVRFGSVKAVTQFGRLTGQVFDPGLHFKMPFIQGTEKVRTIVLTYETSDNPKESDADFTDFPVTAQTIDGQQISVKYSLQFRIEDPMYVLQNYGNEREVVENIVKAHSRSLVRLIAQQYEAEQLYGGTDIFKYANQVAHIGITVTEDDGTETHYVGLSTKFEHNGLGFGDLLVRKIDFSEEYINAIEQQQIEQEGIETASYRADQAEYEKQAQIRQAEADAERTKLQAAADAVREIELAKAAAQKTELQAAADANATKMAADAEAYSIEVRGKALRENPEMIEWEFVKGLDVEWGILPDTGITPLLPVPGQ